MPDLATLALCVGTLGLAAALSGGPEGLPAAVWVIGMTAPVAALLVGPVLETDASTPRIRQVARWLQVAAAVTWLGLFVCAAVEYALGSAALGVLGMAAVGLWPVAATLRRIARGDSPAADRQHVGALAAEVASGAKRSPSMVARIVGSEAIGLVGLGTLAVAGGTLLLVRGTDPDTRRLGLLCILLFGASIPLGIRNGLARWTAVVAPLGAPVWIAREGIVEEGDGTILFPWEHLLGFELIERRGRPAVRVWLQEHTRTPFLLLDPGQDAAALALRAERRRKRLETTRALSGAPLIVREARKGHTVGEVYRTLVRVAQEPETLQSLPSVLDDPPPIDLGSLPRG